MVRPFIRIDNQIVERLGNNGCIIGPIRLFERQNRVRLDLDSVPYVFTGSRLLDTILMQRLLNGNVLFDNLPVIYPRLYVLK